MGERKSTTQVSLHLHKNTSFAIIRSNLAEAESHRAPHLPTSDENHTDDLLDDNKASRKWKFYRKARWKLNWWHREVTRLWKLFHSNKTLNNFVRDIRRENLIMKWISSSAWRCKFSRRRIQENRNGSFGGRRQRQAFCVTRNSFWENLIIIWSFIKFAFHGMQRRLSDQCSTTVSQRRAFLWREALTNPFKHQ